MIWNNVSHRSVPKLISGIPQHTWYTQTYKISTHKKPIENVMNVWSQHSPLRVSQVHCQRTDHNQPNYEFHSPVGTKRYQIHQYLLRPDGYRYRTFQSKTVSRRTWTNHLDYFCCMTPSYLLYDIGAPYWKTWVKIPQPILQTTPTKYETKRILWLRIVIILRRNQLTI